MSRQSFVEFAMRYEGCSATGNQCGDYLRLMSRGVETDQVRKDMAKMSSCALFVRALWWCYGAEHAVYDKPYCCRAPQDVIAVAKDRGAYRGGATIGATSSPDVGDAFHIAMKDGKREHFGVITKRLQTQAGSWKYETVEGGQGFGGTAIERLTRSFVKSGIWGVNGDRVLVAWFDFDALGLPGLRAGWA